MREALTAFAFFLYQMIVIVAAVYILMFADVSLFVGIPFVVVMIVAALRLEKRLFPSLN